MGVKELWPLLESAKQLKHFEEMKGETVAVDLSMWIVDSQCVKQMHGAVKKPHLRNIFFRTSALLHAGIQPVFVTDGVAPELKWETIANHLQARQGKTAKKTFTCRQANRNHFRSVVRECCELLDCMGVQYIESDGEAEAMCAHLNSLKLVDAVITEDGDAFLYGAETIYKDFTTTKVQSVQSYKMASITAKTSFAREHLIALALLIGCDYCPKGVPGIGVAQASRFCKETASNEVLDRLLALTENPLCARSTLERTIAGKISKMESQQFTEIIEEFLSQPQKAPPKINRWKKPLLLKAQDLCLAKLEWPINYTLAKMLKLLILWSLDCILKDRASCSQLTIQLQKILKKRTRKGVECLEILWTVSDPYKVDDEDKDEVSLSTVENLDIVKSCFPSQVEVFLDSKSLKKSGKSTRCKTKPKPGKSFQPSEFGSLALTGSSSSKYQSSSTEEREVFGQSAVSLNDDSSELSLLLADSSNISSTTQSLHDSLVAKGADSSNGKLAVGSYADDSSAQEITQSRLDSHLCSTSSATCADSTDLLLADISDYLKLGEAPVTIPTNKSYCDDPTAVNMNDSIVTGHLSTHDFCGKDSSRYSLKSSNFYLGELSTHSDLSLLSLDPTTDSVDIHNICSPQSLSKSTPLKLAEHRLDSHMPVEQRSYGNFDILPHSLNLSS